MKPDAAAIENLLRLARSECGSVVAFAALSAHAGTLHTYVVPSPDGEGRVTLEEIGRLVRQVSADPGLARATVLVRAVHVGTRWTLAVARAPDEGTRPGDGKAGWSAWSSGGPHAMVGVLYEAARVLDDRRKDLLVQFAERLGGHACALREVDLLRSGRLLEAGDYPVTGAVTGRGADHPFATGLATGVLEDAGAIRGPTRLAVHRPVRADAATAYRSAFEAAGSGARGSAGPVAAPFRPSPANGARSLGLGERDADAWWLMGDRLTGLSSAAQFFSQAGRLLAAEAPATRALMVVLVEVADEQTAPAAARALTSQLRYSDPIARIGRDVFAVALLLVPGGARGDAVEQRLGRAVRASLDWLAPVRTAHVVAMPGDRRDVDELVRQAIAQLPGMAGAAEPPGGGRGAPPHGSPSPMATS